MQKRVYKKLREFPELTERAAQWFHEKWGIPVEEYRKSMKSAVKSPGGVPQWYVIEDDGRILAISMSGRIWHRTSARCLWNKMCAGRGLQGNC